MDERGDKGEEKIVDGGVRREMSGDVRRVG